MTIYEPILNLNISLKRKEELPTETVDNSSKKFEFKNQNKKYKRFKNSRYKLQLREEGRRRTIAAERIRHSVRAKLEPGTVEAQARRLGKAAITIRRKFIAW